MTNATTTPELITLKALCAEFKVDPREAREKLRAAARDAKKFPQLAKEHKPRAAWAWTKGSPSYAEAVRALKA